MIIHRDIDLRGRGFEPISLITRDMPGLGSLRKAAIERDIELAGVMAFRIGTDMWCVYSKPGQWGRFVDHPILG